MKKIFTRPVRKWIYGLAVASIPVMIYYQVIEPEAGSLIVPLILALLNLTPEDVEDAD